jgi:hypothetical protein
MSEMAQSGNAGGYRLDELGWVQFERLAHELLVRDPGLAATRWQGRADEGRFALVSGDAVIPGIGQVAGPVAVVVAWTPTLGESRLVARLREADLVPRSVVAITNRPDRRR